MWLWCDSLHFIWIKHFLLNSKFSSRVGLSGIWDSGATWIKVTVFKFLSNFPLPTHTYLHIFECTYLHSCKSNTKILMSALSNSFSALSVLNFYLWVPLEYRLLNLCMDRYSLRSKCTQRGFYQQKTDIDTHNKIHFALKQKCISNPRKSSPHVGVMQNLHPTSSHPSSIFHICRNKYLNPTPTCSSTEFIACQ